MTLKDWFALLFHALFALGVVFALYAIVRAVVFKTTGVLLCP